MMDWCGAVTALTPLDFSSTIASKPPCPKMGLASVVAATMDWATTAMDWVVAIMTLAPSNFSFPSTATTIVKMKVDQRRIGIEGLEFGVVKTKMVLELEVVETGYMKKPQRWWWVLATIEGKLMVINGNSGRRSPRAAITWWLYFNSLFFSVEKPKKTKKMMKEEGKSKRWARKPLQILIDVNMEAWMLLWKKNPEVPRPLQLHNSPSPSPPLQPIFLIGNEDPEG